MIAFRRIDSEVIDIADTLGASHWGRFWNVELPLIVPGLVVSGAFAFAISLGEFGATYFLARQDLITLSIGIYQLIGNRQMQLAAAMATLLMVVAWIAFFIIEWTSEDFLI